MCGVPRNAFGATAAIVVMVSDSWNRISAVVDRLALVLAQVQAQDFWRFGFVEFDFS